MKTYKNLWDEFISKENFELAYRNSIKGKGKQKSVREFKKNWEANLENVRQMVIQGQFRTSPYRTKTVYEPKKRTIYKLPYAPDRIVQHALMNVLKPIFTRLSMENSYACIEGRGQIKASLKCSEYVRKYKYCLKCDIRKFYPSISQEILSSKLHRVIRDEKIMKIVDDIVFSFPGDFNCPIGNYTSQWFGNFYLRDLDNFVLHQLRPAGYERYCDDFMLFDNDKVKLKHCRKEIDDFIWYELLLEFSKAEIFTTACQGVDFCGYRHFKDYVLLRKRTGRKLIRRYRKIHKIVRDPGSRYDRDKIVGQIASGNGLMKHACAYHLRISVGHDRLARKFKIRNRDAFRKRPVRRIEECHPYPCDLF